MLGAFLAAEGGGDEARQYKVVPDGPGTAVYSSTKSGVLEPNCILNGGTETAAYLSEKGLEDDEEQELQGWMVPVGLETVVYSSANSTALESSFEDGSFNCPAASGAVVHLFVNSIDLDSSLEEGAELQGRILPRNFA